MRHRSVSALLILAFLGAGSAFAGYTNFEVSHVHPIDIATSANGSRLLVVNTPDAKLEVFALQTDGGLLHERSIPVGLEPVTVVARNGSEAWVVNYLSDGVSIVDLDLGLTVRTLHTGNEPTDVAFAAGRAFVAIAGEDRLQVFDLADLDAPPASVTVFSRRPRALAASADGTRVYLVTLYSGNQTTVVPASSIWGTGPGYDTALLSFFEMGAPECAGSTVPPYPSLPDGIVRNPEIPGSSEQLPGRSLIVRWEGSTLAGDWRDEAGTIWSDCLPFVLPDFDLFAIDASTLSMTTVAHLGTSLFDVSVQPGSGKIYVPNTSARNFVRFEHPLGLRGHVVDNQLSIVDPANGNDVARVDLNVHIDRASDPATNLAERLASISQPGMLVWNQAGTSGYLTAIGSRKLFRVDGACAAGSCIFGPNRATPTSVEVGEGPTGVALDEARDRLYVLNRFTNSVALVEASTLTKIDEIPLHDPSPTTIGLGRRFLYDAIIGSGHGDAACSTCHISGDRDDLAWDLGNPESDFVPYTGQGDNVRFVVPQNNVPTPCEEIAPGDPLACASQAGFDPQKGPMATTTLRGMLEPLHWRGDQPTMSDFNRTFVELLGAANIGPIDGKPAALTATEMAWLRDFALGIAFPPNPNRPVDSSLFNLIGVRVAVPGTFLVGEPYLGFSWFRNTAGAGTDGEPCSACHKPPFGAAGGVIGGVTPQIPTSLDAAPLADSGLRHGFGSGDFKVSHLRNAYEKIGPRYGTSVNPGFARSGFGLGHDGSVPDLVTLISSNAFPNIEPEEAVDLASYVATLNTGTKPAVGQLFTLPAGTPPTGNADEEQILRLLVGDPAESLPALGDRGDPDPDCELTAAAPLGGRVRSFRYEGGAWRTDVAGEPALSTTELRETVEGPITFLCTPPGSGLRLGGDRDEDSALDGDDCAAADPGTWAVPTEIVDLVVDKTPATALSWPDHGASVGPDLRYDVLGGELGELVALGRGGATGCVASDLATPTFVDGRPDPAAGSGYYYLVRGVNSCGLGDVGVDPQPTCP